MVSQEIKSALGEYYIFGKKLGAGGFGAVYTGIRKYDNAPVAIKVIKNFTMDPFDKNKPLEVCLMHRLAHIPGVIKLLDAHYVCDKLVIVMERIEGGMDLYDFIPKKEFTLESKQYVFRQLVETLLMCLDAGVVHHDVKPENILIDPNTHQIKLIDFGCGSYRQQLYTSFAGTAEYLPPEYYRYGVYEGEAATVWSLGVFLYQIMCDQFPFDDMKANLKDPEITEAQIFLPDNCNVPPLWQQLIRYLLMFNAGQRPTLRDILLNPLISSLRFTPIRVEELNDLPIIIFDSLEDNEVIEVICDGDNQRNSGGGDSDEVQVLDATSYHLIPTESAVDTPRCYFEYSPAYTPQFELQGHVQNYLDLFAVNCGIWLFLQCIGKVFIIAITVFLKIFERLLLCYLK